MSVSHEKHVELCELLEALCEERLSAEQMRRMEQLVLADVDARQLYLQYIDLHGSLYWDTAAAGRSAAELPVPAKALTPPAARRRASLTIRWTAAACVVFVVAVVAARQLARSPAGSPIADGPRPAESPDDVAVVDNSNYPERNPSPRISPDVPQPLDNVAAPQRDVAPPPTPNDPVVADRQPLQQPDEPFEGSSDAVIVAFINERLEAGWRDAAVEPSPQAEDAEWLRRVYLDVVGHIPPVDVAERFLASDSPRKHAALVEDLLDDPDYARHWTTVWTNLLIGRAASPDVNRPALERFLRRNFAENRPWNEIVADLVAAEGDSEEVGATNFLLAHLNNQATPATAITARLFLGTQFACMQCHDHPSNDSPQAEFWALNAFFQQTDIQRRRLPDQRTGQMLTEVSLVSRDVGGPTYFEDRRGIMQATYPKFAGVEVDDGPSINRRRALAELMTHGEKPLVAQAIVNRLWDHFFGEGFTRPLDDMGPHNPPTHPELLDRLAREFVAGGYDLKRLIRWIVGSRTYRLSSRYHDGNEIDRPELGEAPLFSRVYLKHMSPEQLFDSLLLATRADFAAGSDWDAVVGQRNEWLQQFVIAFGTDENDETTAFEATVPQALAMMNGLLIDQAVGSARGTFLQETATARTSEAEKIRRLCLAALSRDPTSAELTALRRLLRERIRSHPGADPQVALAEGLQDIFWAYLNSSEFVLVH